jgi:DNA-binding LacI/PurR family transcriptional regulator
LGKDTDLQGDLQKQWQRPTMKEVAAHAKVSISTVSYVLNDKGQVSSERRERVLKAVSDLNYIQNASARNLKRQMASTIGLVVRDLDNQFFSALARGVVDAAADQGVLVVLCSVDNSEQVESGNARLLRSQQVDGVIYDSGFHENARSLLELQALGPVVLVDERIPGLDLPSVVADGRRGTREIARHVVKLGHQRFACIAGPSAHWTSEQRLAGYREGLAMEGLEPDQMLIRNGDYKLESGYEIAKDLLSLPKSERATALLCANDMMAIGAMEYCRSSGIAVPGDVSIVGFDDIPMAHLLSPRLTTVRQPAYEMGRGAVQLLFTMTQSGPDAPPPDPFAVDVVIRESTAAPRAE